MDLSLEHLGNAVIVSLPGDVLDSNNSAEFKLDLTTLMESENRVILDMRSIRFVDSSGCGALLTCVRKLKGRDGDLKLFGLSEQMRSLFKLLRLDEIIEVFPSKEDAIRAFGA